MQLTGSLRPNLIIGTVITTLLLLVGCSAPSHNTSDSNVEANPETQLVPDGEDTISYPLALPTPWGESTLEERPERIAVVSPAASEVELLASLGVTPILASDTLNRSSWVIDELDTEIEEIYTFDPEDPFPLETIASKEPDLIVALTNLDDVYDQLSTIAPVLGFPDEGYEPYVVDWRRDIRQIAEVLDLQATALEVVASHDQALQEFREAHPELHGLTASYLMDYGEWGVSYGSAPGSTTADLLTGIGFAANPRAEQFADYFNEPISEEMLPEADADVIFYIDTSDGRGANLTESPLWRNLSAVQNDRAVTITQESNAAASYSYNGDTHPGNLAWSFGVPGPIGTPWLLGELDPILSDILGNS